MKRWLWAVGPLLWLVGCVLPDEQAFLEERSRACGEAFSCPEGSSCVAGFCVPGGIAPEIDGGACNPACAPYEACTVLGCVPRYTALVVTPGDGGVVGAGPVLLQAELVLRPGVVASFPAALDLRVVRGDGGSGGALTLGAGTAGLYPAQWTPPGEGVFLLTAAYPLAAGPSTTVSLSVDTTPPAFSVTVPPADAGTGDGGTVFVDPLLASAWRRDQVVPVEVRTLEPNLDLATVMAVLRADGGVGPPVGLVPFAPGQPCDAGFCGVALVKLWEPPFPAFRGPMTLEVHGSDRAGNPGRASASVNVTRWKWRHEIAAPNTLLAAPAIGNTGVVYVGTTNNNQQDDGQLLALSPEGFRLSTSPSGAVVASPVVGALHARSLERVHVALRQGSLVRVGYFENGGGAFIPVCADVVSSTVSVQSSLALAPNGASGEESVYGVYSGRAGGMLFASRAHELRCLTLPAVGDVRASGTMLALGNATVFGTAAGDGGTLLKSYSLDDTGTSWTSHWTQSLPGQTTSLAYAQGQVLGATQGASPNRFFLAPADGAGFVDTALLTSSGWHVSVGASNGNVALVGGDNSRLFAIDLPDGLTRTLDSQAETFKGAPVWGAGGYVYVAGTRLQARRPLETVQWQFSDDTSALLGSFEPSMNLDCARGPQGSPLPGRPGVLYAARNPGRLYAFIVDSPGLDPAAPWPRFQHDARNTGNPATPLTVCP